MEVWTVIGISKRLPVFGFIDARFEIDPDTTRDTVTPVDSMLGMRVGLNKISKIALYIILK